MVFILVFTSCALLIGLSGTFSLRKWKASIGEHWTERARLFSTANSGMGLLVLCCLVSPIEAWYFFGEHPVPWVSLLAAALGGIFLGSYPFDKTADPETRPKPWAQHQLQSIGKLGFPLSIYVWLYMTLPDVMSAGDWIRVGVGLGLLVLIKSGFWVRWIIESRNGGEELARVRPMVSAICKESGMREPRIGISDIRVANACALVFADTLIFTKRLVHLLNDEELSGICRHELAHLTEPYAARLGHLLRGLVWFPLVFLTPLGHWFGNLSFTFLFLICMFLNQLSQKVVHWLEKRADAAAHVAEGPAAAYATALEKLHEANRIPAVGSGKGETHPFLYDRMLAAGVQPAYERPKPPADLGPGTWIGLTLVLGILCARLIQLVPTMIEIATTFKRYLG